MSESAYLVFLSIYSVLIYCSIPPLSLDNQQGARINKNIILYFYSSIVMLVWSKRAIGERIHDREEPSGVRTANGN